MAGAMNMETITINLSDARVELYFSRAEESHGRVHATVHEAVLGVAQAACELFADRRPETGSRGPLANGVETDAALGLARHPFDGWIPWEATGSNPGGARFARHAVSRALEVMARFASAAQPEMTFISERGPSAPFEGGGGCEVTVRRGGRSASAGAPGLEEARACARASARAMGMEA